MPLSFVHAPLNGIILIDLIEVNFEISPKYV